MLINVSRRRKPRYRDIRSRILRKSRSLMRSLSKNDIVALRQAGQKGYFKQGCPVHPGAARRLRAPHGDIAALFKRRPVAQDNWLRCWFNGIDAGKVERGNHCFQFPGGLVSR